MAELHGQLELFGVQALLEGAQSRSERERIKAASAAMLEDFSNDDSKSWSHSAFCMTGLPHSRPTDNENPWHRKNGSLHLVVEPGTIIVNDRPVHVGVPFGAKARLILLYIQSHVDRDGVVLLGRSLTDWMRRLEFSITGGDRGTLRPFKEQVLRLSRARISLHWTQDGASSAIADRTPVDGLMLWANNDPLHEWQEALHLSPAFYTHLKQHSVPLWEGAIRHLRGSSLGLDLYCWLAYRLRLLKKPAFLRWSHLRDQLGAGFDKDCHLAAQIRGILPDVLAVYPDARVEVGPHGLTISPSRAPVPEDRRGQIR